MLRKHERLSAREVKEVLKKGRSLRSGDISLRFVPATNSKAAIVVSSKVAKGAVERNRLRRKGYRALSLPKNMHAVFFIQKKDFNPRDILSLCSKLS